MTQEQKGLFELLELFSDICEQYGLRYYLAGGTLLGAVRHRGFIPWDDDVDVMMPIDDYKRFIRLSDKLPEGIEIQSDRTDENYPFLFIEFCNTKIPFKTQKKHGPMGIYIDVFPLISSRPPTRLAVIYFNVISVINYVLQVKCDWATFVPYKKRIAQMGYCILKGVSNEKLRSLRHGLVKRLFMKYSGYLLSPGGGHKGAVEFYPKHWFTNVQMVYFEEKQFPAPSGWNEYLKQLYKDYMSLPEIAERKTHHNGTF